MDNLFEEVSVCGKFQVVQVTLIQACRFVAVWALSLMMFGLYNPGWRCVQSNSTSSLHQDIDNTSEAFPLNHSVTSTSSLMIHTAQMFGIVNSSDGYHKSASNSTNNAYSGTCDIINSCSFIEFDPTSSTIVTEFGLVCDKVWIGYLIVSTLNFGMLIGAFVWGQIGERFGRKVSLYCGNVIMAISCGLAVFSPMWEVYAAFTFIIGFGTVGVVPSVNVLSMEFLNSKWRARVTSFPVCNAALICFAAAISFLRNWKYIHLASAFVCGVTCLGFFFTAESLRWLVINDKLPKAEELLTKISKSNNKPVPTEMVTQLLNPDGGEQTSKHYTYLDLFRTRDIRFLIIRLAMMWSISIFTYEIIGFGIQSLPGDFYTNIMVASSIEFPGILLVGPLANKLGRRRTGLMFISIGVLCCASIVISLLAMEKGDIRDLLVTSVAVLNKLSIFAIVSLMIPYGAELIPTAVRNLAFGVFNISVRLTGMAGSYIIPRDYTSMIACFAVLMLLQIVATVIIWSLTETKDKPLKDAIKPIEMNAVT